MKLGVHVKTIAQVLFAVTVLTVSARLDLNAQTAQAKQPNIIVIMGDDIGWFNLGSYNLGIMLNATPNLDKLATEGMRLTDYYAEASCTAGRANFITGELPIRTGLTTVGQAGSLIGLPAQAPTIAVALKALGYETAQFDKNHIGDHNNALPCVHASTSTSDISIT
jgi:arylsulfatase A-like enzyme